MRLAFLSFAALSLGVSLVACGARTPLPIGNHDAGEDAPPVLEQSGKVDLLFMIDNSGSMGDKQELLRQAVPDLMQRLIQPKCLDGAGTIIGDSKDGKCDSGKIEFKPVPDIHVAVITSALGGAGANVCVADAQNPDRPDLLAHNDDQGHLVNRTKPNDAALPEAAPANFLAWFPDVEANKGNPKPPVKAIGNVSELVTDFQSLVAGVGESGCGFEAQLEAWYRFLVQPDPYDHIEIQNASIANYFGVDATLIKQRHDFLRPDSLLGIIMVTDENDSNVDPRALGGRAWQYLNAPFPGSPTQAPPRATPECDTAPFSPQCTTCLNASCPTQWYSADDASHPNTRLTQPKKRYGVALQFPLSRYVDALTSPTVPNREGEHPSDSFDYVGDKNCTNPIFAAALPEKPTTADALCKLPRGPRGTNLVYFALIGGLPHQLLQKNPSDPNSAQKDTLSESDWLAILGKDPEHYDSTGADLHMIESIEPRAGLPPPTAADNADPIHGREYETDSDSLQYACTFPLTTPRDCTSPTAGGSCDCANPKPQGSPLCSTQNPNLQVRAKAYPTIRELTVAHALGARASVSSLCPIHVVANGPNDQLYGYRPAIGGIVEAFRKGLVQ
ncbi:hypothetical protein BH09MYX1_BH09MYX1_35280 [soil metagenome]